MVGGECFPPSRISRLAWNPPCTGVEPKHGLVKRTIYVPNRKTITPKNTHQALINYSFESTVKSWLLKDGWQVFEPVVDHGHQTDLLISDGPNYYRIQVKSVGSRDTNKLVQNQWSGSNIDCVVYFSRDASWGFVAPAFREGQRQLNHPSHKQFQQNHQSFLKAFHSLEVH